MKVAHIAPISYMMDMDVVNTNYHMILASIALNNDAYWKMWASRKGRYAEGAHIILDNGVYETRESVTLDQLHALAKVFGVTEIVLPDVWKNSGATITSARKTLKKIHNDHRSLLGKVKLAAVVQGDSRSSWMDCFDTLNHVDEIDTIMIPKVTDEVWGYGGRFAACAYIAASGRIQFDKDYHLLGVWTDPLEIYLHSIHNPWIRSVDTALAVHAGLQGVSLQHVAQYGISKPSRPVNYFNAPMQADGSLEERLINANIKRLNLWAGGCE